MVRGAHPSVRRRQGNMPARSGRWRAVRRPPLCLSATRCSPELALCRERCPRLTASLGQGHEWGHGRVEDRRFAFLCVKSFATLFCPNKVGTGSLGSKGLLCSWVWKKSHPSRYPCSSRSLLSVGQMVAGAVGCSMSVPPRTAAPCKPAFLLSHAAKIKMGPKCAEFMGVI